MVVLEAAPAVVLAVVLEKYYDDTLSHSAFDAATQIVEALSSTKHMLCVFHAVSMRYQDLVYGHLPKNQTAKLWQRKAPFMVSVFPLPRSPL